MLPQDVWRQRHKGIVILLWLHVPVLFAIAVVQGVGMVHASAEAGIVAALALGAVAVDRHMTLSTVVASLGLMACSAELVHLSHGLIEMHFHFFVMVGVVTLYQDWRPFLVAIGSVLAHHSIAGSIDPASVYNHPAAIASPWKWAAIHAMFIVGMSAAGIITWKLNELLLLAASEREHRLAEAQGLARIGSWEYAVESGRSSWSDGMRALLGVDEHTTPSTQRLYDAVHPDDLAACRADLERALSGSDSHDMDYRIVRPDGSTRWVHSRCEAQTRGAANVAITGTIQDITERRESEDALRTRELELRDTLSLLNATLESTGDGILVVDLDGRISSYNGRFAEMWSLPQHVLLDRDDSEALAHVVSQLSDPDAFIEKVIELYAQPDAESTDTIFFKDGRVVERFSMPQRVRGGVIGRVWSFHDITDRIRLEQALAHQAFHDSLTGIANQFLFRDRLDHALARRRNDAADQLAILFLDIDNFKDVNDSLGHAAGDQLLIEVAQRLQASLRPADTAARLGGDEFALILEDLSAVEDAEAAAQRVLDSLARPIQVVDKEITITVSMGIVLHRAGNDVDELLRNADLAMYAAKRCGKNRFERFVPEMHDAVVERLETVNHLRGASARGEFHLQYQPIVALDTGALESVEALIRWRHPTKGVLSPDDFISFAEDGGLIEEMGQWVLREACTQARRWHLAHPGRPPIGVGVNLSPHQLRLPNIAAAVAEILETTELPPGCLTLEITEGVMMEDTDRALARLTELKALGLMLAVDDFGTGYSSLSYLQQFPIDVLKIDRSFVGGIEHGAEESALAHAIIRLARSLQLSAVAEGVENAEQLHWLQQVGCAQAQGFYLGRPMDAADVTDLLRHEDPFASVRATAVQRHADADDLEQVEPWYDRADGRTSSAL